MKTAKAPADDRPHILCLGGGYVAIYLVKVLRRAARRGQIRLTVVDIENYQCFHGLIPEMLTGKIQATDVLSPARKLFDGANFVNADIEGIDLERKQVTVARMLDGKRSSINYDQLVLAVGSTENLGRFPGLAEHAFRLKSYSGCLATRNHLIHMLELADMESDPQERRRLLTFVIVGGNYAGIEVAGELRDFLPELVNRRYPNISPKELSIIVVVSGAHILPELKRRKPNLVEYAAAELEKDPLVDIRYNTLLTAATKDEAVLNEGIRIPCRTIISCAGMSSSPLFDELGLPRNDHGRLRCDQFARVEGTSNLWSGGDCGAIPLKDGGDAPALAIWAMNAGALIGKNIRRTLAQKDLKPYSFNGLGDACVIGGRKAVAHLKGVPIWGRPAWLIWRIFMIIYLPTPEKRVRTVTNWLIGLFFGRDLVNMRVHQPLDLAPLLFEPGQDIIREGDEGTSMYVIQEGEVEVYQADGTVLATLGKGKHFGEVAVFKGCKRTASVRAISRVKVLQLRRQVAMTLSETLPTTGERLKANPASLQN